MMSSMHRKLLLLTALFGSAATLGATLAPQANFNAQPAGPQNPPAQPAPLQQPQSYSPPSYAPAPSHISVAIDRWSSLRQSDNLPFSSYASFLTSHRGWPGESGLRRSAERAISPDMTSPSEVTAYFRLLPPLTNVGHARLAFALLASGNVAEAQAAARTAWTGGVLPRTDEDRLLSLFGAALSQQDHDRRMETLLDNGDTQSAERTLPLASFARRTVYETRLALQTNAGDAGTKLGLLGPEGSSEAGLVMDRANWLRRGNQSVAARALLAQPRTLTTRTQNAERWLETLLTMARGAANDSDWQSAYQIASRLEDAYAPGTRIIDRSADERDHYTSLAWLAGIAALQQLGRPADAANMFVRYARGGRSAQVMTKGLYWAGRAAEAAGQPVQATSYFTEASAHPELFYAQLALERLGRTVAPPASSPAVLPTDAERAAFEARNVVQATRLLGMLGRRGDQSLFVRSLAEQPDNERERMLAAEFGRQIGRTDLGVWVGRSARNVGTPFYMRSAYPEVSIPPAQAPYWSLAHGIIRQESSFDRTAVSPVGARGLMQLMPATAREVSGKMGLEYDQGRLTEDPSYNIMLGSRYFEDLMAYWGGNAPLAVASYNAGMGNVRKWINAYGDPRLPGVDVIRWIEEIPFNETKGYVQRVLENAVVYDAMHPSRARSPERARLSYYLGKPGRPG